MQHLYDALCGHSSPATQDCLQALTIWINLSLSGKVTLGYPLGWLGPPKKLLLSKKFFITELMEFTTLL